MDRVTDWKILAIFCVVLAIGAFVALCILATHQLSDYQCLTFHHATSGSTQIVIGEGHRFDNVVVSGCTPPTP